MLHSANWICNRPPPLEVYWLVTGLKVPLDGLPTNGMTTNCFNRFEAYAPRFCGFTPYTPANVNTSPTLSTIVVAVQPDVCKVPLSAQPLVNSPELVPVVVYTGVPPCGPTV